MKGRADGGAATATALLNLSEQNMSREKSDVSFDCPLQPGVSIKWGSLLFRWPRPSNVFVVAAFYSIFAMLI